MGDNFSPMTKKRYTHNARLAFADGNRSLNAGRRSTRTARAARNAAAREDWDDGYPLEEIARVTGQSVSSAGRIVNPR